jgi:transposase-like protein
MMKNEKRMENGAPAASEGARRATGDGAGGARRQTVEETDAHNRSRSDDLGSGATPGTSPAAAAAAAGALAPGQRWSAARKREVALRLLRGESVEALSRELGVEIYRLEEWKSRALNGIDASLREREATSERLELDSALKRLGELMMDQEVLLERCRRSGVSPLVPRRSGK